MPGSYEKNIRWKAIGIYMLIAAVCLAASLYIYSLGRNVRSQKQHIENYSGLLKATNQVVFSVSEAQSMANLYLNSKNTAHLRSFREKVSETETLLDSLAYFSRLTGDTSNLRSLMEIGTLLVEKGDIIYRLNNQMTSYNPVDELARRLLDPEEPLMIQDSVRITTIVSDTVVTASDRANFWDRVSTVLTPGRQPDTLKTISNIRTDTIRTVVPDSSHIAPRARDHVEEVRSGYSSSLRALERQINSLLVTDQEISGQIIEVVNRFHRGIIQSTLNHIEQSEQAIQRNYRYSFGAILLSLVLVTLLIILIINDTNKGQRSRYELEQANRRISEIMESRHKLLLSVSHDIKTPLNAILGYLELWRQGRGPEAGDIASAEFSGKHINALIGNLLEFSSLEQGTAAPSSQDFRLLAFCEDTVGMIRMQATRKGIELNTAFDFEPGICVTADAMRTRQIVLNILSNAVKYTSRGTISFRATYDESTIRFTVSDTGAGMDSDQLERIFKPFYRVGENSPMAEGHGFGMFVVKGLVELLQGDINIESEPGRGTTVEVTIPATRAATPASTGRLRILFVDDDRVLLRILCTMATNLGHAPDSTSEPADILSGKTDITSYDLIITDMEMGNHTGTQVLEKVRSTGKHIPVIVMSGRHDLTADKAAAMGFDGYMPKPVTSAMLETVTGNGTPPTTPATPPPASASALSDLLGDGEELREIIDTFKTAARDDIREIRSALFRRDWRRVREICHRLLPLFRQFGGDECTAELERINSVREASEVTPGYWKDVNNFIGKGSEFIERL